MTWLLAISIPFLAALLAGLYYWWESNREARREREALRRYLRK
jgi:hypothetical protein